MKTKFNIGDKVWSMKFDETIQQSEVHCIIIDTTGIYYQGEHLEGLTAFARGAKEDMVFDTLKEAQDMRRAVEKKMHEDSDSRFNELEQKETNQVAGNDYLADAEVAETVNA